MRKIAELRTVCERMGIKPKKPKYFFFMKIMKKPWKNPFPPKVL